MIEKAALAPQADIAGCPLQPGIHGEASGEVMSSVAAAKNAAEARSIKGLCADAKSPRTHMLLLRTRRLLLYTLHTNQVCIISLPSHHPFSMMYQKL